jgi:ParB/RepB/Spo0J family partition protein
MKKAATPKDPSAFASSIAAKLEQVNVAPSDAQPVVSGHGVVLLPRAEIYVDEQVRKSYPEFSLKELADSISAMGKKKGDIYQGLLQAISVGKKDDRGYPVTFGHRRFLAIDTFLKWDFVPSKVDEAAREDLTVLGAVQLVENIQREDLSPIEVALGIAELREQGSKSGEIATLLGKENSYVSKHLRIASIPMDLLLELSKVSKDVEALYAVGQLAKKDLAAAAKVVAQAVKDNKLTRADVAAAIERVDLAQRKGKLPSATRIEQEIQDYYLADPQEPLTLSSLRELMGVIEDDHELFVVVAAPVMDKMTAERDAKALENAAGAGEGNGQGTDTRPPADDPENAAGAGAGTGKGADTTPPADDPENAAGAGAGTGKGADTTPPADSPKSFVDAPVGPVIKVRWLGAGEDDGQLFGRLVTSKDEALGIKVAEDMAMVMTDDGKLCTVAMDELLIYGVTYA